MPTNFQQKEQTRSLFSSSSSTEVPVTTAVGWTFGNSQTDIWAKAVAEFAGIDLVRSSAALAFVQTSVNIVEPSMDWELRFSADNLRPYGGRIYPERV